MQVKFVSDDEIKQAIKDRLPAGVVSIDVAAGEDAWGDDAIYVFVVVADAANDIWDGNDWNGDALSRMHLSMQEAVNQLGLSAFAYPRFRLASDNPDDPMYQDDAPARDEA